MFFHSICIFYSLEYGGGVYEIRESYDSQARNENYPSTELENSIQFLSGDIRSLDKIILQAIGFALGMYGRLEILLVI